MTKIEMVVGRRFFEGLLELMVENSILNYSVIEILKSHGEKQGDTVDYGFLSVNKSFLVVCVCEDQQLEKFKTGVIPFLQEIDAFVVTSPVERLL